jgi:uncharacterized protein
MAFCPVLTAGNGSYIELIKFFQDLTGDKEVLISTAPPVLVCDPSSLTHAAYGDDLSKLTLEVLRALWAPGTFSTLVRAKQMLDMFIVEMSRSQASDISGSFCTQGDIRALTMDLYGNLLSCQNFKADDSRPDGSRHGYGHIRDIISHGLISKPAAATWDNRPDKACANCPVLFWCRGGCPFAEEPWRTEECKIKFAHRLGILAYALFIISGYLLERVEGDFKYNGYKMLNLRQGEAYAQSCIR